MSLQIGARFPNTGRLAAEFSFGELARRLEDAGFDSLWVSDHLAMPTRPTSRYPFSDDGRMSWDGDLEWHDPLIVLALAAGATHRIALGTAVLVALLRHPLVAAKQLATLQQAAGGRVQLGVGAGWLREEFDAVGVPFGGRGSRLDSWIERVRSCWGGDPGPDRGGHYPLPQQLRFRPRAQAAPLILVGGTSAAALRRVGTIGDGWLGIQRTERLDPAAIAQQVAVVRRAALDAGRDPDCLRVTIQLIGSHSREERIADSIPALAHAGVHEIIVDPDWTGADGPRRTRLAVTGRMERGGTQ